MQPESGEKNPRHCLNKAHNDHIACRRIANWWAFALSALTVIALGALRIKIDDRVVNAVQTRMPRHAWVTVSSTNFVLGTFSSHFLQFYLFRRIRTLWTLPVTLPYGLYHGASFCLDHLWSSFHKCFLSSLPLFFTDWVVHWKSSDRWEVARWSTNLAYSQEVTRSIDCNLLFSAFLIALPTYLRMLHTRNYLALTQFVQLISNRPHSLVSNSQLIGIPQPLSSSLYTVVYSLYPIGDLLFYFLVFYFGILF